MPGTRSSLISLVATVLAGGVLLAAAGCTPPRRQATAPAALEVTVGLIEAPGEEYEQVFGAVREVLRDYRFAINRIDAARGVITTHPKRTAGIASPWDQEQSSLSQEWEDLVNQQQRVVRVLLTRAPEQDTVRAVVEVQLQRVHRPYWRVETESMRLSSYARALDMLGEPVDGSFVEVLGLDSHLAQRIAASVEAALARKPAAEAE